jgi:hypothetical protein
MGVERDESSDSAVHAVSESDQPIMDRFIGALDEAGVEDDEAQNMIAIATDTEGHVDQEAIAEMVEELEHDKEMAGEAFETSNTALEDGDSEEPVLDSFIDAMHVAGFGDDEAHAMIDRAMDEDGHANHVVIKQLMGEIAAAGAPETNPHSKYLEIEPAGASHELGVGEQETREPEEGSDHSDKRVEGEEGDNSDDDDDDDDDDDAADDGDVVDSDGDAASDEFSDGSGKFLVLVEL